MESYRSLKLSPISSLPSDDESSSYDSNYESLRGPKSMEFDDTDDEYQPATKKHERKTRNSGKRLKTLTNNKVVDGKRSNSKLRNNSSSMDDSTKPSIERLPTRKPNPKIFNRNALMARENRRRKKEQMKHLERSMEECKTENRKLRKILKQQTGLVDKLKHEKIYLKSIIANKTGIMSLLKTIQKTAASTRMPITSSMANFVTSDIQEQVTEKIPAKIEQPSQLLTSDDENGRVVLSNDPYLDSLFHTDFSFTDYLMDYPCSSSTTESIVDDLPALDNWESILNDDTPFNIKNSLNTLENAGNSISSEHNYFNMPSSSSDSINEPGICLHLNNGRVSLEFCADCHYKSENAWIEEY